MLQKTSAWLVTVCLLGTSAVYAMEDAFPIRLHRNKELIWACYPPKQKRPTAAKDKPHVVVQSSDSWDQFTSDGMLPFLQRVGAHNGNGEVWDKTALFVLAGQVQTDEIVAVCNAIKRLSTKNAERKPTADVILIENDRQSRVVLKKLAAVLKGNDFNNVAWYSIPNNRMEHWMRHHNPVLPALLQRAYADRGLPYISDIATEAHDEIDPFFASGDTQLFGSMLVLLACVVTATCAAVITECRFDLECPIYPVIIFVPALLWTGYCVKSRKALIKKYTPQAQ